MSFISGMSGLVPNRPRSTPPLLCPTPSCHTNTRYMFLYTSQRSLLRSLYPRLPSENLAACLSLVIPAQVLPAASQTTKTINVMLVRSATNVSAAPQVWRSIWSPIPANNPLHACNPAPSDTLSSQISEDIKRIVSIAPIRFRLSARGICSCPSLFSYCHSFRYNMWHCEYKHFTRMDFC